MKFRFPIAIACVLAVTACTHPKDTNTTTTVNPDSIVKDASLTPKQKGEKLALGAEQLMMPASFMYADAVADIALTYDSGNLRAQMIKALLKPALLNKGILKRVAPIAQNTEKGKADYQKTLDDVSRWPNNALRAFVLDGKEDIKTEADGQAHIAKVTKAYDALRLFFKNHKDMELSLHLPGDLWQQQLVDERARNCLASAADGQYTVICNYSDIGEYKINRAENESAQQAAAGALIYQTMLNSYNADGVLAYIKSTQNQDPSTITQQQTANELMKTKRFGTVRDAKGLGTILDLGLDAVGGARWAAAMQASLCKDGVESDGNRPGYLLKFGICVLPGPRDDAGNTFADILRTTEFALRGGILNVTAASQDGSRTMTTAVKPSVALTSPVQDIRSLGPFTWSADGTQVTAFGSKTLGGTFVNGDINRVLTYDGDVTVHAAP